MPGRGEGPPLQRTGVPAHGGDPRWGTGRRAARHRRAPEPLAWAFFEQKRKALQLWHEHLDKKILEGRLIAHTRRAVDGTKQLATKLNMKLGPHSGGAQSDGSSAGDRHHASAHPGLSAGRLAGAYDGHILG